jgi:hypothetical protein
VWFLSTTAISCTYNKQNRAVLAHWSKAYRMLHHVDWLLFTSWHSIKYSQNWIFIMAVRTLTNFRNSSYNSLKY